MEAAKIKLAGGAVLVVAAAGGGHAWARIVDRPEIVEIGSIACGVPPQTASFGARSPPARGPHRVTSRPLNPRANRLGGS